MPGGININDSPTKIMYSKKTKKIKPSYHYKPAEPAESMATEVIGQRYVLLENIKTWSQKNRAKGVLQEATALTNMRSEVGDKGLDQPEKGGDWPERDKIPSNLDWPIEKGGNWLGDNLDWHIEEDGNQSENNDDLPKEGDNQEGEEDQPKEGDDLPEEEDVEVLPVELEEPPMFIANESADKIENILEEDTEGMNYQRKKDNKRKTHIRATKETMSDDDRNKNDKEKTYVMESGHNEMMEKMSRPKTSSHIKLVKDWPMSKVQLMYVSRDLTPQGIAGSISTSLAKKMRGGRRGQEN